MNKDEFEFWPNDYALCYRLKVAGDEITILSIHSHGYPGAEEVPIEDGHRGYFAKDGMYYDRVMFKADHGFDGYKAPKEES